MALVPINLPDWLAGDRTGYETGMEFQPGSVKVDLDTGCVTLHTKKGCHRLRSIRKRARRGKLILLKKAFSKLARMVKEKQPSQLQAPAA